MKYISVRITEDQKFRVDDLKDKIGLTQSEILREVIERGLNSMFGR
jgi:predicted DNA-binding protein